MFIRSLSWETPRGFFIAYKGGNSILNNKKVTEEISQSLAITMVTQGESNPCCRRERPQVQDLEKKTCKEVVSFSMDYIPFYIPASM